ncbi:MAG: cytochrome b/b6 domain-containing protein [Aquabacterium sp.]
MPHSATPTASTAGPMPTGTTPAHPGRRVTDAPTRMFHWLFAASFLGAYLTAEGERWRMLHVTLGYTMVGLLVFRLVYGLIGPRPARLGVMWRKVSGLAAWLRSMTSAGDAPGSKPWRQGQNLSMALLTVALLATTVPLTFSGYALYNEWGEALTGDGEWLEELHEFFGNGFLMLVLGHIALIAVLSVLRRRNQALPMLTGRMPGAGPDVVPHNRGWLAALVLAGVMAFITWQWQTSPKGLIPGMNGPDATLADPSNDDGFGPSSDPGAGSQAHDKDDDDDDDDD